MQEDHQVGVRREIYFIRSGTRHLEDRLSMDSSSQNKFIFHKG